MIGCKSGRILCGYAVMTSGLSFLVELEKKERKGTRKEVQSCLLKTGFYA